MMNLGGRNGQAAELLLLQQQFKQLHGDVEKLAGTVDSQGKVIAVLDKKIVPREEMDQRDAKVQQQLDSVKTSANQLNSSLVKLAEEITATSNQAKLDEARSNQRRNLVLGTVVALTAIVSLVLTNLHDRGAVKVEYIPVPEQGITTTTTAPLGVPHG